MPKVSAKYAYVLDVSSGVPVLEKNAKTKIPPASTLKILSAMVVLDTFPKDKVITIPKSVQKIPPFKYPEDTDWKMQQVDVERSQEFRKCIECYLCQNVCHILRNHNKKNEFYGPRMMIKIAELEMHPLDIADRKEMLREAAGIGYCNITKCCTDVCPEEIHITDNAIIPLKERAVDTYFDPLQWIMNKVKGN